MGVQLFRFGRAKAILMASLLFFRFQLGGWALANVVVLLILIGATLLQFWRLQKLAGLLLVPYFLWVAFAALLNYTVWQMNAQL